jgi:ABC-type arginine transport system permease subunit
LLEIYCSNCCVIVVSNITYKPELVHIIVIFYASQEHIKIKRKYEIEFP